MQSRKATALSRLSAADQAKSLSRYQAGAAKIVDMRNTFSSSLRRPFAPSSMGTRVPDMFSFPTATYHLHGTTVLTTNSTQKTCAALFLPNPNVSMIDLNTANGYTSALTTGMSQFATNTYVYGATTPATLSSLIDDFRVTSWGIKISNLIPELSATGRVFIYTIPAVDTVPPVEVLNTLAMTGSVVTQQVCSYAVGTLTTSAVLNLPSCVELSFQDLLHGDIEIGGTYVSPRYFDFKASITPSSGPSGYVNADYVSATSVGAVSIGGSGDRDPARCMGGCHIGIYVEGVPVSTPVLSVEYIYHLEGSPSLAASSNTPVPSNLTDVIVGSTHIVESAIADTAGSNAFHWIEKGADFLNKGYETATKFANSPAGQAIGRLAPMLASMAL